MPRARNQADPSSESRALIAYVKRAVPKRILLRDGPREVVRVNPPRGLDRMAESPGKLPTAKASRTAANGLV